MDQIRRLARLSVLRASGFATLAVVMFMMGTAHDPAMSFRVGALGMLILSAALWQVGRMYHLRKRITETEVWMMLPEEDRPPKEIARVLIVNAMRQELYEKAIWASVAALGLLALSTTALFLQAAY